MLQDSGKMLHHSHIKQNCTSRRICSDGTCLNLRRTQTALNQVQIFKH